ncbi:MAG: hypothetical protein JSR31_06320 [Nitrospira sp.]|nr:hypothetical protein [Nitrospira sp.]
MTLGSGLEIGPFHFQVIRILVAVGVARVIVRSERFPEKMNTLDWLMVAWATWALMSSVFHKEVSEVLVNRLGLVYNGCGIYFLLRVFCRSLKDLVGLCRIIAILLIPLSIVMGLEQATGRNVFSVLGGVEELSEVRNGRIRAQGPFSHSILAGTVGAVCLPLMTVLWQHHRKTAIAGIGACLTIVLASASSGPILTTLFGIGALLMWHSRNQMRVVRWVAVLGYIGLDLVMNAPAYYLLARIDLTGSSTGWHRAALIESAIQHISEWWLAGTDVTRHWMPYGVAWSQDQADITNYYLNMGVWGGLPLMFLFIAVLATAFSLIGRTLRQTPKLSLQSQFMIWALGASLFAHSATFVSVTYFDQSVVFIYLTLALIGSVGSHLIKLRVPAKVVHRPKISERSVSNAVHCRL